MKISVLLNSVILMSLVNCKTSNPRPPSANPSPGIQAQTRFPESDALNRTNDQNNLNQSNSPYDPNANAYPGNDPYNANSSANIQITSQTGNNLIARDSQPSNWIFTVRDLSGSTSVSLNATVNPQPPGMTYSGPQFSDSLLS